MRAFATLAAVAIASEADFPKDDAFHADCHVTASFPAMSCDSLYALVDNEVRSWDSATKSPAGGVYEMYEEQNDVYVWSTRTTKDGKYVDDQMFEFNATDSGCSIVGHSRSESNSVYDYSVNFCNLWNVYNAMSTPFTYTAPSCAYPAADPVTTCARY